MLETIRGVALDLLTERRELGHARERHAQYFVGLAEQVEPALVGPGLGHALDRLEREYDNFRAVLRYSLECADLEAGLRLAGALHRFWMLLLQDVLDAYYAHPYAWDEIGFGGPAYPRGYMRLEGGKPEPREVEEQRYAWEAPAGSLSDRYEPIGGPRHHKQQTPGQEGTH